ncbi:LOW QUALITY PROTEIN: putative integral membrane protein [Rhizobium leguminosarum bv. trifolii WSM2012]|nr:LOW QUALITY PROTEIN: putative integral membrane protein [Rhizobium leguminosarum bv. trifolii WSM2012]EJC76874.1 LOW QUALITY PROTEIN: putative integral membrane protein [Rhizobium leguminosarum bv. trifolii WSM2012]
MLEQWLLLAHVIGATALFGTGAGIAFFMVMAHRTRNPVLIAHVAATVVVADTVFTATAAVLQPVTGYLLARSIGWELSEGWIALSLTLYVVTGLFWLPVVWIQIQLRDLARAASVSASPLPPAYFSLYRIWFACGFPAFAAVLGILWLMLTKPAIALF